MYPSNESEISVIRNIIDDLNLKAGDGYIFSTGRSTYVTFVPADKKGNEIESKIKVEPNEKAIENAKKMAGYNMIITSKIQMTASEIYAAYHNLWGIMPMFF